MGFRKQQQRDDGTLKHSGKHMLLIEDSRVFSTMIRYEIEQAHGMTVTHCASLSDVKLAMSRQSYSVAVLDLNLPDAPNCEALDYVIAHAVPAIVFTGSFNDRTRDHVMTRGVIDCIIKNEPDSVASVVSAVDRTLTNGGITILVADDDTARRETLCRFLRQQQFQVVEAATSEEVMGAVADACVDLVVCEYAAPGLSALSLVSDLQTFEGEDTIPVVALAPADARAQAARFLQFGGTDFIQRPFDMEEFSSRITHVAAIRRRIQALQRLASRDYLTDLFNRRYFFQQGPRIIDHCFRRQTASSIAIIDIDHFKRLNDTYGHEVGDLVLKAVARNLRVFIGNDHLLARLGGEEFGILFNGLDIVAATDYCERLRETIAKAKVVTDDEDLSITVSIGLAPIEQPEVFDNYLNAADQFLYMAKHAGRNRIFSELTMVTTLAR